MRRRELSTWGSTAGRCSEAERNPISMSGRPPRAFGQLPDGVWMKYAGSFRARGIAAGSLLSSDLETDSW